MTVTQALGSIRLPHQFIWWPQSGLPPRLGLRVPRLGAVQHPYCGEGSTKDALVFQPLLLPARYRLAHETERRARGLGARSSASRHVRLCHKLLSGSRHATGPLKMRQVDRAPLCSQASDGAAPAPAPALSASYSARGTVTTSEEIRVTVQVLVSDVFTCLECSSPSFLNPGMEIPENQKKLAMLNAQKAGHGKSKGKFWRSPQPSCGSVLG